MLNLSEVREYIELTQGLLDKQAALIDVLKGQLENMPKTASSTARVQEERSRPNRWGSPDDRADKAVKDKLSEAERFIRHHFKVS